MAEVTIYGMPLSTYVRTARMTCHEKGVSYDLDPLAPQSEEILALNPTGKLPAFRHGDLVLYETSAITRYIDEAFDGPALQPQDALGRAPMNKWISEINDTIYRVMIREIVLPRFGFAEANDEAISESAKTMAAQLGRIDATLRDSQYLAGNALTLADLFLLPILYWLQVTPEGKAALPDYAAIGRWNDAVGERESCKATVPPAPQ